ncbi:unnamed protein product, partial [Onchocerca ochengi]|uniref:TNFR-Cys domain-containing protein n=1 Tax=Onchocerca ochengi TaxID=42157 RepID=A0A182ETN3_ONCOC
MIFSFFFLLFTHVTYASLLFDYITPRNCSNTTAYFDLLNLQCRNCDNGTIASVDHLRCICPSGFIQLSDGTCQKCEQGKGVSENGLSCIECPMGKNETQCSSCPFRYFMQRTISTDGILKSENCKKCPANKKVSIHGDACIPCLKTDDSCECQDDETCQKAEVNKMLIMIELENGSQENSNYIAKNIKRVIQGCMNNNMQACQHLANICVLQNYRVEELSACTEFEKIANSKHYRRGNNGLLTIPTLFYFDSDALIELSHEAAISASFNFDENRPNSLLEIILLQFALNGTFLGMIPLSESNLNTCSQQKDKFHFGTFYRMECFIQLQHLLQLSGGQPIFSDLYLVFLNKSGQKQMYAVPILNENIRSRGEFVNRLMPNEFYNSKWILTRRLYFVDSISLNALNNAQHSAIIRFPEKIDIRVQIQ